MAHLSRIAVRLAAGLVALALASAAPRLVHAAPKDEVEVTIRRGDTLSRIAKRAGVTMADLRKWNRGRIGKNDALRAGAKLRVKPPDEPGVASGPGQDDGAAPPKGQGESWVDSVAVQRGDTAGRIAEREGVALSDLLKWNKLTQRSRLRPGQHLVVRRTGPRPKAVSIGRPTEGRLQYGDKLEPGPGYRLRFPEHTFALESVAKSIRTCAKRVKDAFPGTADVLVGELSRAGGGRFPPHESHQSGRDADLGYYLVGNQQNATLHRVQPSEVDYGKTWAFLKCLLTTDDVSRVYMDKAIQSAMAEWLGKKKSMSPEDLARLFEVVGGDAALVRHAKKHDTHLHVRFSCDADQDKCVEEADEAPFKL